ncbi:MAG: glycosyl hydrolase [Saprospiraceae bacterium]
MKHHTIGSASIIFMLLVAFRLFGQLEANHFSSFSRPLFNVAYYNNLQWRNIGPFRAGRVNAVAGVPGEPMSYYMGATGGGVWKTEDGGLNWANVTDGYLGTGSVGAIAVAPSDPNILYIGMGEHAVRGVMSSHGDGVYKSYDSGKTWHYLGLPGSRHIAAIRIHPKNPDLVYVAVQGAAFGPTKDRGVYKTTDGGETWQQIFFINEHTGAADLSLDWQNPRILYAGMWDHERSPWKIRSGGPASGLYKSIDGGETWKKLTEGLPAEMGKVSIDVSRADSDRVYACIEAEKGGVFRSMDGGQTWTQTNHDNITTARAWYYIEIFADPKDPETVYVLNAPLLKSTDGGHTFKPIANPHSDQHDLWINPEQPNNMILGNDGGACISYNGGKSWSPQGNQPTAQFYRVIADNRFPYYIYGGQQDNTTIAIASRTTGEGIGWKDWYTVAGGESAFIAFDPDDTRFIYGGSYQGNISVFDHHTGESKDIMAYPMVGLATEPQDMKYRFNWNAPIIVSPHNGKVIYHAANVVLKSTDGGLKWKAISPDLTRNEKAKQGKGGGPYTNEGAGGENYNTISYLACSPHEEEVIWVGSDDGLIHLTTDGGKSWKNVTPPEMQEAYVNSIEVSPHHKGTAYIAVHRYKFNDFTPLVYYTADYGKSWKKITRGFRGEDFVRVVREDPKRKELLYAGTETGLYLSYDNGSYWYRFQLNLPVCPITDLLIHDNDLIAATSGRSFWILDDLSSIQQSVGQKLNGEIALYKPKPTVKLDAIEVVGSIGGIGQNPLNGLIIDYYLPPYFSDTSALELDIIDRNGDVIRHYTNQKLVAEDSPKQKVLPTRVGINRFHWDLRRDPIMQLPGVFMLEGFKGSRVAPGEYSIRLRGMGLSLTQPCQILPDPRLDLAAADFSEQQEILVAIESAVRDIHQCVMQMQDVKAQVEQLNGTLKRNAGVEDLVSVGKEVVGQIIEWEKQLIQPELTNFQDAISYPNQLSAELINLMIKVDTHNPQVTHGARTRLNDLLLQWRQMKTQFQSIIDGDLAAYNRLFREKEIPAVIIPLSSRPRPQH